jgi:hypothetical protein
MTQGVIRPLFAREIALGGFSASPHSHRNATRKEFLDLPGNLLHLIENWRKSVSKTENSLS